MKVREIPSPFICLNQPKKLVQIKYAKTLKRRKALRPVITALLIALIVLTACDGLSDLEITPESLPATAIKEVVLNPATTSISSDQTRALAEAPTVTLKATAEAMAQPTVTPAPSLTPTPWPTATETRPAPSPTATISSLGTVQVGESFNGLPIISYRFGTGEIDIILVGAIHGGYEWNTSLLAYEFIDYFLADPEMLPPSITMHIIPAANPDGLFAVTNKVGRFTAGEVISDTVPGRFNGRKVDLNRNWDCQWAPTAYWRDAPVSGGEYPFSEPENQALRDFILAIDPAMVLFWHSAADGVFAAGCPVTHVPSYQLATIYGLAAGYSIYERFYHYPITGDAGDWLAAQDIPTISVELKTHESLDWEQNLAGLLALMDHYRQSTE